MNALVWFRSDLRVDDNPALHHACRRSDGAVYGLFLPAPGQWQRHGWGASRAAFTLRSVAALAEALAARGIPLLVRRSDVFADAPGAVVAVAEEVQAAAVFFNEEYEVNERRRDRAVAAALAERGIAATAFHDQTVLPPASLRTRAGGFYTVFTPFRRTWERAVEDAGAVRLLPAPEPRGPMPRRPEPVPERLEPFGPASLLADLWPAGSSEAGRRLVGFTDVPIEHYHERRDLLAADGTSALSPYLAVGSISVRRCLQEARAAGGEGAAAWEGELVWREFYRHVLVGYPRVCMNRPFRLETERVAWRDDSEGLSAWREGRTGFPVVDAGMRQLAATGWMHNRARMITAAFLAKDLLVDWRRGEAHFAGHLVDLDFANNNGGWQWAASTGTDAAPYFRVFNPTTQGRRFDPEGDYLRRWLPELAGLDAGEIHDPAPATRRRVGYPEPVVDHAAARQRALDAFRRSG